jgi:hypothetical protein
MASYSVIVPGTKVHEEMCHRKHSYSGSSRSKLQGHEADYSHPSSAKVKNGRAILPHLHTSPWCSVHSIKYRENYISHFFNTVGVMLQWEYELMKLMCKKIWGGHAINPTGYKWKTLTNISLLSKHRSKLIINTSINSVALVCERTIPTKWPPHVGKVSANFCG